MNARTFLITATLTLALIGPAAASAAFRQIPSDSTSSKLGVYREHLVKANAEERRPAALDAATRMSADTQAYVPGGSSEKVAKAITSAGRQGQTGTSHSQWAYVPGGSSQKVAKAIASAGGQGQTGTSRSQWAYVPGGSSQKVAKAITSASKPR